MMLPNLSCAECQDLLLEYTADVLGASQRQAVERHLRTCERCQRELRAWRSLGAGVRDRKRHVPTDGRSAAGLERLTAALPARHTQTRDKELWMSSEEPTRTPVAVEPDVEPDVEPNVEPAPDYVPISISHPSWGIWRGAIPAIVAVFVVALLASLFAGPLNPNRHGATPQATATPSPFAQQIHTLAHDEVLPGAGVTDVQMLSGDEGWAVGGGPGTDCTTYTNGTCQSLLLHLTDGRWREVAPVLPHVFLTTLSFASTTEGWAGGTRADPTTIDPTTIDPSPVLLHYSHGSWAEVQVPEMGQGEVFKIQMLSADEGWAIVGQWGAGHEQGPMVLWHYRAGKWTLDPVAGSWVITLSMLSPAQGWAAGTGDILRYENGSWTRWNQRAPGVVTAIAMVSATDGWMAGVAPDGGNTSDPHHLFMLHFDGTSWQPVRLPAIPGEFSGDPAVSDIRSIAMVSPTEGWAVGNIASGGSVTLHYTGGAWRLDPFAIDEPLFSISMVSADEGWAVGAQLKTSGGDGSGVILHYLGGTWSVYKP